MNTIRNLERMDFMKGVACRKNVFNLNDGNTLTVVINGVDVTIYIDIPNITSIKAAKGHMSAKGNFSYPSRNDLKIYTNKCIDFLYENGFIDEIDVKNIRLK